MTTRLPLDLVRALADKPNLARAWPLTYIAQTTSTNDVALTLAQAGAPWGTVVVADAQSEGRGRRGRTWSSPAGGGLYVSVLLQPFERASAVDGQSAAAQRTSPSSWITIMAGVAAATAVRRISTIPVCLKWPNDLVVHEALDSADTWRKLGGVLCEGVLRDGRLRGVVVGIGINVKRAAHREDVAALSTTLETEGARVERGTLLVSLLDELEQGCRLLSDRREDLIRERFLAWSPLTTGARLRWTSTEGDREGIANGVDDEGALCVRTGESEERLVGGDVRWERHGTLE